MDTDLFKWIIPVWLLVMGLLAVWWRRGYWSKLPGPRGWPLIGNALQMNPKCPHVTLTDWAKKYGDMYTINIFGEHAVVVSGEDEIREVLVKKSREFSGRPQSFRISYISSRLQGIAQVTYSPNWQARKKLISNKLRMYGDGLKHLEEVTTDIIHDFIKAWDCKKEQAFDPREDIHHAIINILFCLVFGRKLAVDDPLLKHITYYQTVVAPEIYSSTTGLELDFIPWLRFFGHSTFEKLKDFVGTHVGTVINQLIEEEKKTFHQDNLRGMLDGMLYELAKIQQASGTDGNNVLNETSILPTVISETFGAGTQTTSSTLLSFIGHCVINQSFQERLRMHIIDGIGDRTPSLEDRSKLPLVEASLLEVLRLTSVIPTGIPHKTTQATSLRGISFPKGATVLNIQDNVPQLQIWINLWGLHHDERYWKEPWIFNPDRFLDSNGNLLPADHPNRKRLFTFGAGQRVCLGEALAKNRLFLFVTSLLQHFHLLPADTPPNCNPCDQSPGIVIYPPAFSIKIAPV